MWSKFKEINSNLESKQLNIAFVPVRAGSKSIPHKNIKLLCGQPLVFWCLNELNKANHIDQVIVASDCDQIIDIVRNFNFGKVSTFKRSKENASDTASTEAVIFEYLEKRTHDARDLFILVQATSPFTIASDFDNAIIQLKKEKTDSLLTCTKSKRFIWDEIGIPCNYELNKRPRRQEFDGYLVENGAFYISYIDNILKFRNRIGGNISIYEMNEYSLIEIDEEIDWVIAEKLMENRLSLVDCSDYHIFSNIKVFLSDVDGTLTDSGMYYGEDGNELKKFNTRDGMAFELLKKAGIKTGIITSEKTEIVSNRVRKLGTDFIFQGLKGSEKLNAIREICKKELISIGEVAYIGDDINCLDSLKAVGLAACPSDAVFEVLSLPNITVMKNKGGFGCVREFSDIIISSRK